MFSFSLLRDFSGTHQRLFALNEMRNRKNFLRVMTFDFTRCFYRFSSPSTTSSGVEWEFQDADEEREEEWKCFNQHLLSFVFLRTQTPPHWNSSNIKTFSKKVWSLKNVSTGNLHTFDTLFSCCSREILNTFPTRLGLPLYTSCDSKVWVWDQPWIKHSTLQF